MVNGTSYQSASNKNGNVALNLNSATFGEVKLAKDKSMIILLLSEKVANSSNASSANSKIILHYGDFSLDFKESTLFLLSKKQLAP